MHTYNCAKHFCEILNIDFVEIESCSDQALSIIPDDASPCGKWQFTNKGGTITEEHKLKISLKNKGRTAWNKDISNPLAAANGKRGSKAMSKIATGRRKSYLPDGSWTWVYPQKGAG